MTDLSLAIQQLSSIFNQDYIWTREDFQPPPFSPCLWHQEEWKCRDNQAAFEKSQGRCQWSIFRHPGSQRRDDHNIWMFLADQKSVHDIYCYLVSTFLQVSTGTIFGECLNYKSGLRILIWPLEVPFLWSQRLALLAKVAVFGPKKMALRVAKSKF